MSIVKFPTPLRMPRINPVYHTAEQFPILIVRPATYRLTIIAKYTPAKPMGNGHI